MTAREFVDTIAVPTVEEFQADPTQRRGYLACFAAFHVGDYLKPAGERYAEDVHDVMAADLGAPFVALQRMAAAAKHREKMGKGGAVLMESGSDTERPATGWDQSSTDNPLRFDDCGGRIIEDGTRRFDMLDLCVIVLRAYAKLYQTELAGSAIDRIRYTTAEYPR